MKTFAEIAEWLTARAANNLDKAHAILGAKPGPGNDIDVFPSAIALNGSWYLVGITAAGKSFIAKFWPEPTIKTNNQLYAFKRQAEEWGLQYHVIVKFESLEKAHD